MIQRIQTIYLLLAAVLTACTTFLSLGTFTTGTEEFTLQAFGLKNADGATVQPTAYMGILLVLALAVAVVTIFLYKRRMLQIRICVVEMILLAGSQAMTVIYYYLSCRVFSSVEFQAHSLKLPLVFPAIALIFTFLAARAIFRDEILVRSVDRIR